MCKQHKARNETGLVLFCRRNVHKRTTSYTNERITTKGTPKRQGCRASNEQVSRHESGHVYGAPNIIVKPYRALPQYSRTEPQCKLPRQTSAKNVSLNSMATCAIMVQTLCQDDVALYVSTCYADIERNRSKKGVFFLQESMPCIHGPSVCVYVCTRGSCVDSI